MTTAASDKRARAWTKRYQQLRNTHPDHIAIGKLFAELEQGREAGNDPLLSRKDAGIRLSTWRTAIQSGELRAVQLGTEYRCRRSDVDEYLAAHEVKPFPKVAKLAIVDEAQAELDAMLAGGTPKR